MHATCKLAALMLALSSCATDTELYSDRGVVCLYSGDSQEAGPDGLHDYKPGSALRVMARSPGCFQSGCFDVVDAECGVDVEDGEIRLETFFSVKTRKRLQCKSDCSQAEASCESTAVLAEGTYEVVFGTAHLSLEVPSRQAAICFDVP